MVGATPTRGHIMLEETKHRVSTLPKSVRMCCETEMNIRRSSLRDNPCADDVTLKCEHCYRIQTHGIPITREEYEQEMSVRGRRTIDMVDDGPDSVEANLAALGYIDY